MPHVIAAGLPNIVGPALIRRFTLENGTLALETHPGVWAGKTWGFRNVLEPAGPARLTTVMYRDESRIG